MRKAFFQLHIAILLAGLTGVLGKLISLNEGILVWYRLLFTSVTLWLIYLFRPGSERIGFRDLLKITGVGGIAALHWLTFYGSIKYSNVSVALVCFSAIGFFTALLEPLFMRTKLSFIELGLGLMTILGIAIIFHFDPQYKFGILTGIISAVLGSLFPIFNRDFVKKHLPGAVTRYQLSGGFIVLTLLLPVYLHFFPANKYLPSLMDLVWLLVLSWLCTVLAFNLSMHALRKISAFTVNLSYNLEPLYGIALAFVIFHENKSFSSQFYLGLILIVISVCLQTFLLYRDRRRVAKENQAAGDDI